MKYSCSILVVLYNCSIDESMTLNSIENSKLDLSHINLVIWNNGPQRIDVSGSVKFKNKLCSISVIETLENKPLSEIYNNFIANYKSYYYVILDYDSDINDQYLDSIGNVNYFEVGIPIIKFNDVPRSPIINGQFNPGPYSKKTKVISIGSGIVIGENIAITLKNNYGNVFDERFALYGVDTTFFLRLHDVGLSDRVKLLPGFNHSLSRFECESNDVKKIRNIERSYDFALTSRFYKHHTKIIIIKTIIGALLGKNKHSVLLILMTMYRGHHPRCNKI